MLEVRPRVDRGTTAPLGRAGRKPPSFPSRVTLQRGPQTGPVFPNVPYTDRPMSAASVNRDGLRPMTETPTADRDSPRTFERQGGERPDVERDALFTDATHDAVWRPPTTEEYAKLDAAHDDRTTGVDLDMAHIAILDGFTSDTPGYVGKVAVLVWGYPSAVETATFKRPDDGGAAVFQTPEGAT